VVKTTGYVTNLVALETLDDGRDAHVESLLVGRKTSLSEIVESPRPDLSFLVYREVVVEPSKDLDDSFSRQIDHSRDQRFELVSLDEAAAKLGLLPGAPGVHVA
jgi:hypothetical protein